MKWQSHVWQMILIVLVVAGMGMQMVSAALITESPRISVTKVSQSQDPVEPGQISTVKFKVENQGAQTREDVIVRLLPAYPFTIYGDNVEKNIGKMAARAINNEAVYVEYKIKVDEGAVEQDTELELEVQVGEGKIYYTNQEFKISIQTHDASLDIKSISIEPSPISPGQSAQIALTVKNLADSLLKDVRIKLDLSGLDIPLAPFQSSSERIISQIQTGFQETLTFEVIADPNAAGGLYKIPLNITFSDEQGNKNTINDILAVQIGDVPKMRVFLKKSSELGAGRMARVTVSLANAGVSDVKFLEFSVAEDPSFRLLSSTNYFYIGDVDSDDTESEDLEIYIPPSAEKLKVPLKVNFLDANNQPYEQYYNLEMSLFSESELKEFGLRGNNVSAIVAAIIIAGAGGFLVYRKLRKKRGHH